MDSLKSQFLLDPDIVFLNHGSFGATPKPVFRVYQDWQHRLELQPVLFLGRELDELLKESRRALGEYLHAGVDDLVYIPNATHGVNLLARSLELKPGDEILATDHEYGACDYTWEFICDKAGAKYIHQSIPLPVDSEAEIMEHFWRGITPRTKVLFVSHITSPTALRLPVEAICQRARRNGILTVVDAAHSPGQIPVDLQALDADMVIGNCHKWMLGPKGAGFLFVRKEIQHLIEPLVISWGYHPAPEKTTGSRFIDILQWTGTRDPAAALAVPAAVKFMQEHQWDKVRSECHALLCQALERMGELTGMQPPYPLDSTFFSQMGIAPIPSSDIGALQQLLYDRFRIEIPFIQWRDRQFVRISVQGYNTQEDIDALIKAMRDLLPHHAA